jgi:hypothetical protein
VSRTKYSHPPSARTGKLLNHGGRSVTSRYIKTGYLGRMLAAAQEDISAHLVRALGSPRGMA